MSDKISTACFQILNRNNISFFINISIYLRFHSNITELEIDRNPLYLIH